MKIIYEKCDIQIAIETSRRRRRRLNTLRESSLLKDRKLSLSIVCVYVVLPLSLTASLYLSKRLKVSTTTNEEQ